MPEARIDVVIGSAQSQSGANAVRRAVDGIKGSFIDLSAKAFVAERALEKVWSLASGGARFEETMGRLNRQMGQFHSNAHLMVGELQQISRGTISIEQSATLASRALAAGLNPDQIKTFTQAADALDDVLGTDLPTAFDNIVQAAITGRTQILANIGVYVDLDEEVKRLAVSTNRTTDQITKQEKAMLTAKAITAQAGDALHKLSDGALSDADRLKQVEAKWDNLWTTIGQGSKTAVITALEWMEKLKAGIEQSVEAELKGRRELQKATPGNPNNPVTQELFGRAIVQDATGNLARQRDSFTGSIGRAPIPQLPTGLQGSQLDASRERRERGIQGDLERTKAGLEAAAHLVEMDAQRQLVTQEELITMKGTFRIRELAALGESLSRQRQMEDEFHARRVAIGFESTEERIGEEERYRSKVFDINQALLSQAQAFGQASVVNEQEREQAREAAIEQRGKRLVDAFASTFEIQESLRRQDLEDAQTYYQGEFDMAVARFAGDQEIAQKERELLREQLAFKLRLTQEEVDRILFLRKAGDFEGVRQITGRADPALGARAVEGIVESGTAKHIRLTERANGDFFAGWARGLQDYTQRTEGAFNLSNDMAQRTARAMEQGFQKFFFDGMEGNFNSFKDVLTGVLDFTKQIVSQIAAQMVTVGIIKPGAGALSGLFGGAAANSSGANTSSIRGFDSGGMDDFGPGRLAMLHGKEAIVPLPDGRSIPVTMRMPATVGAPVTNMIKVEIINQMSGAANVEVRERGRGPDGTELLQVVIQAVGKAVGEGRMDHIMRSRYGLSPGERR